MTILDAQGRLPEVDILFAEYVFGVKAETYDRKSVLAALKHVSQREEGIDSLVLAPWPSHPAWNVLFACCIEGFSESLQMIVDVEVPPRCQIANRDDELRLVDGPYVHATPLHLAAVNGHVECVKTLLDAGCKTDTLTMNIIPCTPLMLCCADGRGKPAADVVEMFLIKGADPRQGNQDGVQPLHLAAANLQAELVTALVPHGVDLNAMDFNGRRPLHWLIQSHCETLGAAHLDKVQARIRLLDEIRLDPNLADDRGDTPLHYAVKYNELGIISLLMDAKADHDIKNEAGSSPLECAKKLEELKRMALVMENYVPDWAQPKPEPRATSARSALSLNRSLLGSQISSRAESINQSRPTTANTQLLAGSHPSSAAGTPQQYSSRPGTGVSPMSSGIGAGLGSLSGLDDTHLNSETGSIIIQQNKRLGSLLPDLNPAQWSSALPTDSSPVPLPVVIKQSLPDITTKSLERLITGGYINEVYRSLCQENNVKPNQSILHMFGPHVHMFDVVDVDFSIVKQAYLGVKGTMLMAALLKQCTNLATLNLSNMNLTNKEVVVLAKAMETHSSLSKLILTGNRLSIAAGKALVRLAEVNPLISEIGVAGTGIPVAYEKTLKDKLRSH